VSVERFTDAIVLRVLTQALATPQRVCLRVDDAVYMISDVARLAVAVAQRLSRLHVPHRSVALCGENSLTFLGVFLGARLCDLQVQVLNPQWPEATLRQTIHDLEPGLFLAKPAHTHLPVARPLADVLPVDDTDPVDFQPWLARAREVALRDTPFYTGFTSGSGGVAKGFTRDEASWLASFRLDAGEYGLGPGDTVLCPGHVAHSLFLYALLRGVYAGAEVATTQTARTSWLIDAVATRPRGVVFAVPTQLRLLLNSGLRQAAGAQGLRLVLSSGAKLPPSWRAQLQARFPAAGLREFYGSSELSYIAMAPADARCPADSVGRALPGVDVRILDDQDQACAVGVSGRIFVHSPLRFMGYARARGATDLGAMPVLDDALGTGDSGYLDAEGFLYITGRSDRMMSVAGRNLHPEAIEHVLVKCPGVEAACVLSVPDRLRGERPVAVVLPSQAGSLQRQSLIAQAAEWLPAYAIPQRYFVCHAWPQTLSQKTDVTRLRQALEAGELEPLP